MMEAYTEFARVYDTFMDNIDYDRWSRCLVRKLQEYGIRDGLVCELGCGTGAMTERLWRSGYDMIGIDASEEMLEEAGRKQYEEEPDPDRRILYLNQDMRGFELYGTVRAVVSVCDCLNYITEEQDLLQVFRLVNNYLDPGGIFLFDMNTAAKYAAIGDSTIAENREEGSFIWENSYDANSRINQYLLTLFLPEKTYARRRMENAGSGNDFPEDMPQKDPESICYRKYEELHIQKAYPPETVKRLLREAGLEVLAGWEAFTDRPISEKTERMCFAAREHGKKER